MKHADWTGNGNSIYKTLGATNHTENEREANDYYYSDAYNGLNVYEAIAEYLIMKGVRLKGGTDNGC